MLLVTFITFITSWLFFMSPVNIAIFITIIIIVIFELQICWLLSLLGFRWRLFNHDLLVQGCWTDMMLDLGCNKGHACWAFFHRCSIVWKLVQRVDWRALIVNAWALVVIVLGSVVVEFRGDAHLTVIGCHEVGRCRWLTTVSWCLAHLVRA